MFSTQKLEENVLTNSIFPFVCTLNTYSLITLNTKVPVVINRRSKAHSPIFCGLHYMKLYFAAVLYFFVFIAGVLYFFVFNRKWFCLNYN